MTKFRNALLGFAAGLVAMPLIILLVPFAFAWWMANETDEEDGR